MAQASDPAAYSASAGETPPRPGAGLAFRRLIASLARHPLWSAPVLGALAACGFRPLGFWPLTLLGVAGLIALVGRAPGWRRAGLIGWLWGVAHFTLGNNWIATAFTYQAKNNFGETSINTATVTVTIDGTGNAPTVVNDTAPGAVTENAAASLSSISVAAASGALSNDIDTESNPNLKVSQVDGSAANVMATQSRTLT